MKSFFSVLLLMFCITVSAQELTVKSFEENTRDISARTSSRFDNNDVPCALVKVQLASAGAVFDGAIVGKVEYKTSEYWVYMPKGSKRLTVKLENYLPLPVEFNPLESNVTYVLTIAGVMVNGQPQEVCTKTGWIILDSSPQGAAVYINGEFVGNTPLNSYKQPYGAYEYKVEMPNYHSTNGIIELNSGQIEKRIQLKPAFGSISITSNIAGANVLLDGKNTGKKTPCTLTEVSSGVHVVSLQKEKYAPIQYNVTVQDVVESKVEAQLAARFATITINTLQGAEILIDGDKKGSSSCVIDLMEGYYDVEVCLAHHSKATKQIQVVAGQPQTISLNPKPIYGSLDVTSTPRGASITIDDKPYGHTPFTAEELLEGNHTVTLSLKGYADVTKKVAINKGQAAVISATLQEGRELTITTAKESATIFVDGQSVGKSPYTGTLSFGTHTAYATLNGKTTSEKTFSLSPGVGALPDVVLDFFEYVDLGLSVKWATCNVGASKPEDYGDYFAWGETTPKSDYSDRNLKYSTSNYQVFTKYCLGVDHRNTLDLTDDAASNNLGGTWRMPTKSEFYELFDNCTWTWISYGGECGGYKVTSRRNGNSIFLPAAGKMCGSKGEDIGVSGCYWSSSNGGDIATYSSYGCSFSRVDFYVTNFWRSKGLSVRPVCP